MLFLVAAYISSYTRVDLAWAATVAGRGRHTRLGIEDGAIEPLPTAGPLMRSTYPPGYAGSYVNPAAGIHPSPQACRDSPQSPWSMPHGGTPAR